jgi:transketolase
MGDQIGAELGGNLYFVPQRTFDRVRRASAPAAIKTSLFADLCRINALYMVARAGSGHLGSSFSSLDLVSWIALNELDEGGPNRAGDLYFSSKGHDVPGLYAALSAIGALPGEVIHGLRQISGVPGHPDVGTPGIVTNTGSLGMGISKAKGMVIAHRARGERRRIFVLTGDGELQEGQIWESLATAAHLRMDEITVFVDHNKLQSDTFVKTTNDLGDLERKFSSFGWVVRRIDGHDPEQIETVIRELDATHGLPKVVIADTIKGCGVSFMEHTQLASADAIYRYHSGALDAPSYRRALLELSERVGPELEREGCGPLVLERAQPRTSVAPSNGAAAVNKPERMIDAYSAALLEAGHRRPELIVLDADLAVDLGLMPFKRQFPKRFVECGIAEMDMVSQAGGMALRGLLPVCHSFACFLTARPNEHIYNNASERTKVIYVAGLGGLLPAAPGHSHQGVRDIAALSGVPRLCMLGPSAPREVKLALDYALDAHEGSVYLRLCSLPWELPFDYPEQTRLVPGRGIRVRSGRDAVVIAYGPVMLSQAYLAAEQVSRRAGFELEVVALPWLNHVDAAWLERVLSGKRFLFTIDDHYVQGGQGQLLAACVAESAMGGVSVQRFGVTSLPACGTPSEVLQHHGLDAESLAEAMRRRLEGAESMQREPPPRIVLRQARARQS